MEQIETMPMTAGPGVFGLHENANIACALAETFVIFDTILLMEVRKPSLDKINEPSQARGSFSIPTTHMTWKPLVPL